jgi:hypothetical protein
MDHDVNCKCCSNRIGGGIPIIIFPSMRAYTMPSMFQTNWQPQMMPMTNMALQNNFNNFNMAAMGMAQSYPPQNVPPPQNYPPQNNMMNMQPPQNNFNQAPQNNMNMNGQQNQMMQPQQAQQQFNNSNMNMMNGGGGNMGI